MAAQPPANVDGLPTLALKGGQATTPKSSPTAFWIPGIAHRPHHCIAARPWVKEEGSHQSVGAPSRIDLDRNSSRILANDCFTSGVVKPGLLSAVRKSLPTIHRIWPSSDPPPKEGVTPASLPMNRPFWSLVVRALDAAISSSMVAGGFTPALSSTLLR